MAVLSCSRRFLFIQTPRTGCTAVAEGVLIPRLGGVQFPVESIYDGQDHLIVRHKHAALDELLTHGLLTPSETEGLFKFTAVRNPFDSLVSAYVKRSDTLHRLVEQEEAWIHKRGVQEDMKFAVDHSFTDWLEYRYTRDGEPVAGRHFFGRHLEGMDFVMRFERLQQDFNEALARIGVEPIEIPQVNVTLEREGRSYRDFYDDRSREIVEHAFTPTLERFGYCF